jgi:hypothetical protein
VRAQVFNSRTCQLVLGAGALAAAGLRSITAKHLAMAAQCLGAVIELHPALTAAFTAPLPHARRAILLPDFERVLQARNPETDCRIIACRHPSHPCGTGYRISHERKG